MPFVRIHYSNNSNFKIWASDYLKKDYITSYDLSDFDIIEHLSSFKKWSYYAVCDGKVKNGSCVYSVQNLALLANKKYFFVDNFLVDQDPISYQCMQELLLTKQRYVNSDSSFYCNFIQTQSEIAECFDLS